MGDSRDSLRQFGQSQTLLQVLLVTGGYNTGLADYLDTTETRRETDHQWTTVSSARLPTNTGYFSAVTLDNQIFAFG